MATSLAGSSWGVVGMDGHGILLLDFEDPEELVPPRDLKSVMLLGAVFPAWAGYVRRVGW